MDLDKLTKAQLIKQIENLTRLKEINRKQVTDLEDRTRELADKLMISEKIRQDINVKIARIRNERDIAKTELSGIE